MGKEELLDALAGLQATSSAEGLEAQFDAVHEALSDIHRKRWRFLEDSCAVVLRQVFRWISGAEDDDMGDLDSQKVTISTTEAIHVCLKFIEPLIQSTVAIADASDDEQEAASQRGVLVAALLQLFAKVSGASRELKARLVLDMLTCGVDTYVILATLRFREELVECRRALLPSYESDSETESELDSDDEDEVGGEAGEFRVEDTQWIVANVAKVWGLTKYKYFLQTAGQEYSFAAWSYHGVGNFAHALLTEEQDGPKSLLALVSPFSWLFHIAAYAHHMIHDENLKERFRGLEVLRVAVGWCPQGKLLLQAEQEGQELQSFQEHVASFRGRDWVSPLIQVITNAMVSFPEASDRSATLQVLKELVAKVEANHRFWLLRGLVMKCPYANVGAVLVDFVRADAVQAWSLSEECQHSPYKTTAIASLLTDALSQSAERDLALHADLIASCLSLLRFLYIRDKENLIGIRTKTAESGLWEVLVRINKRLRVKIDEASGQEGGVGPADHDLMHLMILEAALGSTLELCS